MKLPVILALDTREIEQAKAWINASIDRIDHFKVGLEFYLRHGFKGVQELQLSNEFKLFLDLKLYDIPNTVKGAVEVISQLSPKYLSVHASGGSAMIKAAVKALPAGSITAVTVLTSFSEKDLALMGQRENIIETTKTWASNALQAGASSLVCSPFEVAVLRNLSASAILITPGVRVEGDDLGDQVRVMTPKEAISNGANLVVIGRSITGEWDGSDLKMRRKIEDIANSLT